MTAFFSSPHLKKFLVLLFSVFVIGILFFVLLNIYIIQTTRSFIFKNLEDVPSKQVALLLGAKVYPNGRMSDVMSDRALTALELYKNKKIQKILISGDHGRQSYDEVNTIKDYLLKNSVPAQDIFLDHAGFDTYDSLYRAKAVFQVSSVIIVTQDFHLPRAVYIGKSLQLDAVGLSADKHSYVSETYNQLRESLARLKAFFDVMFQAKPKFLGPTISIQGDSKLSWDELYINPK
jgi:SanA protein